MFLVVGQEHVVACHACSQEVGESHDDFFYLPFAEFPADMSHVVERNR